MKKLFDTLPLFIDGAERFCILVTEGSERSALHHSCFVKSSRCSTWWSCDEGGDMVSYGTLLRGSGLRCSRTAIVEDGGYERWH